MKLYDAYGREVDTRTAARGAGRAHHGGSPQHLFLDASVGRAHAERLTQILREAEFGDPFLYLELAEEMEEKDLHYLAVLEHAQRSGQASRPAGACRPPAKDDLRAAAMVRAMLADDDLELASAMFDVLDALGKGFSATEIIWDTSGREWFPGRLRWRDPRWFMFDWVSGEEMLVRS